MIITPEIELYNNMIKSTDLRRGASYIEERVVALEVLLDEHPELDYTDELLAFVNELATWGCACSYIIDCRHKRAQALIAKIEGKK